MKWVEIAITTTAEASEAISNILMEAGAHGVAIEDPDLPRQAAASPRFDEVFDLTNERLAGRGDFRVMAYFPENNVLEGTLKSLEQRIRELSSFGLNIGLGTITRQIVDEADWANAWKAFYHVLEIGERFVICPSWESDSVELAADKRVIYLDPGMAFGTGDHPTTALCLEALERLVTPGDRVLDLGTGSGILAIGAALLEARVEALDIDPVAVGVARDNVKLNRLEHSIDVRQGTLDTFNEQVDLIVANIVADVIKSIASLVPARLGQKGTLLAAGIIELQADEVVAALTKQGLAIGRIDKRAGWVAIEAHR